VKGADRTIKDKKMQTAIDKARENEFHVLVKMLNEEYSYWNTYLNLRVSGKSKK